MINCSTLNSKKKCGKRKQVRVFAKINEYNKDVNICYHFSIQRFQLFGLLRKRYTRRQVFVTRPGFTSYTKSSNNSLSEDFSIIENYRIDILSIDTKLLQRFFNINIKLPSPKTKYFINNEGGYCASSAELCNVATKKQFL